MLMSKWVKAQSQETLFFLMMIILIAGFGGLIMLKPSQDAVDDGEDKGFLGGLFDGVINIFVTIPESDDDGDDGYVQPPPSPPPTSDVTVPTSLSCSVVYNVLKMGQFQFGTVSGNGRNYPVMIYVKHRGTGQIISIAGFLNDDGMWSSPAQKMDVPGYWEAWAETDTKESTHILFTVEGIKVLGAGEHYSKTMSDSFLIEVVSHYKNTNVQIIGNYPAGGYSAAITSTSLNSLGYASVAPGLDHLSNGDWELDALVFSDRAASYPYGTWWVRIGR